MQVKLLQARAGVDFSQSRGDVIDVSEAEGERMIAAGQAERVGAPAAKAERAVSKAKPEVRGE